MLAEMCRRDCWVRILNEVLIVERIMRTKAPMAAEGPKLRAKLALRELALWHKLSSRASYK